MVKRAYLYIFITTNQYFKLVQNTVQRIRFQTSRRASTYNVPDQKRITHILLCRYVLSVDRIQFSAV